MVRRTLDVAVEPSSEFIEAVALLVSKYGAIVKVPCLGMSVDVHGALIALLQPVNVRVAAVILTPQERKDPRYRHYTDVLLFDSIDGAGAQVATLVLKGGA